MKVTLTHALHARSWLNCRDGQYSSARVHSQLNVREKEGVNIPSSVDDYDIIFERLPELSVEEIDGI